MSQLAQLKGELEEARTMQFITNAFTEVNSIRAKNIRDGFKKNRRFYDEITRVYHSVKLSAAVLGRDKSLEKKSPLSIFVAITSNLRFYGKLNANVMEKFAKDNEGKKKGDLLVIGQTGVEYLDAKKIDLVVEPLRFKRDFPDSSEVSFLIEKTRHYDRVLLYYPKFINMVTQQVGVLDITQAVDSSELAQARRETLKAAHQETLDRIEKMDIFEPEVEKIAEFFEKQVRTLLLIRTMLETELSRTAARLLSMSAARERAEELIGIKKNQYSKINHSLENAKILETFAGMSNWNGFGK